ncbi:MAG TPA: cytochrome B [Gammaproteobacteria bacterium]|nr:cytochrome B [Gammaproteobacteria bacterium]
MTLGQTQIYRLSIFATLLAFVVVVLGAYVRLSDAGLGCPDWPGCYGLLGAPVSEIEMQQAAQSYPGSEVDSAKAWKEMVHRYFAGTLGIAILAIMIISLMQKDKHDQPIKLPIVLLVLVIFQALLGMWTVTLLLKPVIVMGHLLGGFATLSLLLLMALRMRQRVNPVTRVPVQTNLKLFSWIALIILIIQIALGGWTSANYAALACPDFPTCQGQWWPSMNYQEGFTLWRGLGMNYEGGLLSNEAQMAVHFTHRLGAFVTLLVLGFVAHVAMLRTTGSIRKVGILLFALLAVQILLGISNVVFSLPLLVAAAHNGVGALLLLAMVTMVYAAHSWTVREVN